MSLVIATLETPNFRFEAVGATQAQALELLETAWSQHFDDMGQPDHMLSFDAVREATEEQGARYFLTTRVVTLGATYRDGVPLTLGSAVVAP
ncbi:hypothetical protein [Hydrogenophaga sp.]|uniref:hypothetical protein n=1 Tax=Hydrogenophaga sp. TaxID=1904254 RepID=UPI0027224D30|nr:hypothetical protein [Hydrogenophaga sp.]MDO9506589.1 hypothetical protein [Hydrogenophaga sp.]